jgi:hypothetical protein
MGEKIFIFNSWPRDVAILYHSTFHYTFNLHINHMIFLHTYLFGLLLLCSCGGWIPLIVIDAMYIIYAWKLIQPHAYAIAYSLFLCAIGFVAKFFLFIMESEYDYEVWEVVIIGVGIIIVSFMCQLYGHHRYEDYTAPPSLTHGLFAAPILEFQCFLYWSRLVKMDDDVPDLTLRVRDNRTQLSKLTENRDQII